VVPREDPYVGCNFLIEVEDIVVAGFKECSGISAEVEVETFKEGGIDYTEHKLPKGVKYANLVLKKGLTDSTKLWDWFVKVAGGDVTPRGIYVILRSADGEEKRRWSFAAAYPVKWSGPDLNAESAAVAIEAVEFVHKGFVEF
jgi:phage tail-like protein